MYSLLSRQSIDDCALCEITKEEKSLIQGRPCTQDHSRAVPCDGLEDHPSIGTLSDARMGVRAPGETCVICSGNYWECFGHPGKIILTEPVFATHFIRPLKAVLRKLCSRCLMHPAKSAKCGAAVGCCQKACAKIVWKDGYFRIQRIPEGKEEEWSAKMIFDLLEKVERYNPDKFPANLSSLVISTIEVLPSCKRPYARAADGRWSCAGITTLYANVVHENRILAAHKLNGDPRLVQDTVLCKLQQAVSILYDSKASKSAATGPSIGHIESLFTGLAKKKGHIRNNLLGKRVNNTARGVIIGDPFISMAEIGVPISIAQTLTYPEAVTALNLINIRVIVASGEGWSAVRIRGERYTLKLLSEHRLIELSRALRPGDVLYRWLRDGDWLVMNRQPTLHKLGMLAHKVKVLPYSAFRLHPNWTTPYNADFDGDEMNAHAPQTLDAVAEIETLMSVQEHLISPNSQPTGGFIQNTMLSAYLMSGDDVFLTKAQACRILAAVKGFCTLGHPAMRVRSGKKWSEFWTGKQLISYFIPDKQTQFSEKKFRRLADDLDWDVLKSRDKPYHSETPVLVYKGRLLCGQLTKSDLGTGRGNLLHNILLDSSNQEGLVFMDRLNWILNEYLDLRGFTVGIGDCFLKGADEKPPLPPAGDDMVNRLRNMRTVCQARTDDLMHARYGTSPYYVNSGNALQQMYMSGSKGSPLNATQITCSVGPQDIHEDGDVPFLVDRSLVVCHPGDNSPAARGYVASNYIEGLNASEMFFHICGGRKGLVISKLSPSSSGYLQRQMGESSKNLKVDNLGRVVGDRAEVYQFRFGEDGLDWRFMRRVRLQFPPLPDHLIKEEADAFAKEEFMLKGRDTFDLAFDFEKLIQDYEVIVQSHDSKIESLKVHALLEEVFKHPKLTPLLRAVIRRRLPPSLLTRTCALENLLERLIKDQEHGMIQSGEPVGMVAAQSLSEQVTQKTLDTFHHVGNKSKDQATQATPRLEELFYARLENIHIPRVTMHIDSPLAATSFARRISARPLILSWAMATPVDFDSRWAHRWIRIFGKPAGDEGIRLVLDRDSLVGSLSDYAKRFPNRCMHSHEVWDEELEFIVMRPAKTQAQWINEIIAGFKSRWEFAESVVVKDCQVDAIVRGIGALNRVASALVEAGYIEAADSLQSTCVGDVLRTFGIEAARTSLMEQTGSLQSFDGGYVNERHLMVVVDIMCWCGTVKAAKWNGIGMLSESPLAQACFERPTNPLVNAAVGRIKETKENVSVGVLMSTGIALGTGYQGTRLILDESAVYYDDGGEIDAPEEPIEYYQEPLYAFGELIDRPRTPMSDVVMSPMADVSVPYEIIVTERCHKPVSRFEDVFDVPYSPSSPFGDVVYSPSSSFILGEEKRGRWN